MLKYKPELLQYVPGFYEVDLLREIPLGCLRHRRHDRVHRLREPGEPPVHDEPDDEGEDEEVTAEGPATGRGVEAVNSSGGRL